VAAVLVSAAMVVAAVVASEILTPTSVGSRASGDAAVRDPAVIYPAVGGDLGIHLTQLQDAVAGTDLEDTVLAATVAAAEGDYESASRLLDAVSALTETALRSGDIDADRAESIDDAISEVQSDLDDLLDSDDDGDEDDSPGNSGNGNGNGNGGNKD
jgi:hypothetical protein